MRRASESESAGGAQVREQPSVLALTSSAVLVESTQPFDLSSGTLPVLDDRRPRRRRIGGAARG